MTRTILTETKLKSLKPKSKPYKLADGKVGGMFAAVSTAGGITFRLSYKFDGKHQQLTLGQYPMFSLGEAREMAESARKQIVTGTNPAATKKAEKTQVKASEATFRMVAGQWFALGQKTWAIVTEDDTFKRLEKHILPVLGDKPIAEIGKDDIKPILQKLYDQEKLQTLKKVRGTISQILRYAIDMEIPGVEKDWTEQLIRQYPNLTAREKHRAAIIDPRQVKGLLLSIEGYRETSLLTHLALKFSALTFARPGEVRRAEWSEIDWENELWRIESTQRDLQAAIARPR